MSYVPEERASAIEHTQNRDFWLLMAYATVLGIVSAVFSLIFLGVIGVGGKWYTLSDMGWLGGQWWWVAVAAGAGVIVGALRRAFKLPDDLPGLVADITTAHVDSKTVPGLVAVSAVSLIGGASLGPEKALGSVGGGVAGWMSDRHKRGDEFSKANTLDGFAGAYGGLLSSPVVAVMMVLELARPGGQRLNKALLGGIIASSVSFGIYFAIAGSIFVGIYQVPQFQYHSWNLLAGVGLGVLAAAVTTVMIGIFRLVGRLVKKAKMPPILRSTLGGAAFGIVGVLLPLTMFSGSAQLHDILANAAPLGAGLLAVVLLAKMFTFAVSSATGFVGGPIFPSLFVGGVAGVIVNLLFPSIPLGLAFACMLAAVPGSLVSAPFSMVLFAALMTQVGVLASAPILVAVATSYLAMTGVKYFIASRRNKPGAATAKTAAKPATED